MRRVWEPFLSYRAVGLEGGTFEYELGCIRFIQRRATSDGSESCWGETTKQGVKLTDSIAQHDDTLYF